MIPSSDMAFTKVFDKHFSVFAPVMFTRPVDLVVFRRVEDRGESGSR